MSKLMTALRLMRTPMRMIRPMAENGLLNWMPDEMYLRLVFRGETGTKLQLNPPVRYNEKLQWLKLHDRRPEYRTMVDKYDVKPFVAEKIGEKYLIPTLGIWSRAEDIDFDALPNRFVLKCTHDSGSVVICRDKSSFDIAKACSSLNRHLKKTPYWFGREWPYKDLTPRIIAEAYIEDADGDQPDYKVMCFGGKAKLIEFHTGRHNGNHTQDFYDTSWHKTKIVQRCVPLSGNEYPKPICLTEMLQMSEKLSVGLPQLRVDWYVIDGKLLFGEMTFFDASGFELFEDPQVDLQLGSWIDLNGIQR